MNPRPKAFRTGIYMLIPLFEFALEISCGRDFARTSPLSLAWALQAARLRQIPFSRRPQWPPREKGLETAAALSGYSVRVIVCVCFIPNCLTSSQDLGMQPELLYLRRTRFAPL